MRALIRATQDLSEMRAALLRDLREDDIDVVEDFVIAVNEVVAAVVASGGEGATAVDVRWWRRAEGRHELFAEVRSVSNMPVDVSDDELVRAVVSRTTDHVEVERRIGGSVVAIRRRLDPPDPGVPDVADSSEVAIG